MLGYFILHLVSIHPNMRQTFFLENDINFLGYNFFYFMLFTLPDITFSTIGFVLQFVTFNCKSAKYYYYHACY